MAEEERLTLAATVAEPTFNCTVDVLTEPAFNPSLNVALTDVLTLIPVDPFAGETDTITGAVLSVVVPGVNRTSTQ